jgi:hypothetical protein
MIHYEIGVTNHSSRSIGRRLCPPIDATMAGAEPVGARQEGAGRAAVTLGGRLSEFSEIGRQRGTRPAVCCGAGQARPSGAAKGGPAASASI